MRITSLKRSKKGLVDIYADGEYLCSLEDIDAARLHLIEGMEADADELLRLSRFSSARRDALKLLLARRYSRVGLYDKLLAKGHGEAEAAAAVEHFTEAGYIDDADYAMRYTADAVKLRREGELRIRAALEQRGVPDDIIDEALARTAEQRDKNLKALVKEGISDLGRLRERLLYKGYKADEIDMCIEQYLSQEEKFR